jgi:hypothetical protein
VPHRRFSALVDDPYIGQGREEVDECWTEQLLTADDKQALLHREFAHPLSMLVGVAWGLSARWGVASPLWSARKGAR